MLTKSIRWRFQLWLAFLLVCVLSGFGITAHRLHRNNQFEQIDHELERRLGILSSEVYRPAPGPGDRRGPPGEHGGPRFKPPGEGFGDPPRRPPPELRPRPEGESGGPPPRRGGALPDWDENRQLQLSAKTQDLFADEGAGGFYFAIWSRTRQTLAIASNLPPAVPIPTQAGADTSPHLRTRSEWREAYRFTERGDCALVGRSIATDLSAMRTFAWWLIAGGGGVLALGLGGGWWLVGRALQPVREISATASRIAEGNLAERINTSDTENELGRLAGVLNSTFARLQSAFEQQQQFTADAAHELRTPIAVLISEAQTILSRERTSAEYREAVRECLHVAQQMRSLTESLLELARVDAVTANLPRHPLDLADAAQRGVEQMRPLAAARDIEIRCNIAPAPVIANADRLGQVITNLLANAISYNKPGGQVCVTTGKMESGAFLSVRDTGIGIAAEDLPHIFERFYRADKARSRADGHAGLGLAICEAIVRAEGGTIEVASEPGAGSTFTARFPLSDSAATDQG